jgi:hypothetical protein
VVIHASRDDFSPREKTLFVHYLVAEGFIPDVHRGFCAENGGSTGLQWRVEAGSPGLRGGRRSDSFMTRLLVYGFVLWVIQMAALLLTRK